MSEAVKRSKESTDQLSTDHDAPSDECPAAYAVGHTSHNLQQKPAQAHYRYTKQRPSHGLCCYKPCPTPAGILHFTRLSRRQCHHAYHCPVGPDSLHALLHAFNAAGYCLGWICAKDGWRCMTKNSNVSEAKVTVVGRCVQLI